MKNSWLLWIFIGGVVVTVFFAFNYQGDNAVPLSEIFPENESEPVDIEYEFVDQIAVSTETQATNATAVEEVKQAPQAARQEVLQAVREEQLAANREATTAPAKSTAPTPTQTFDKDETPFTIQISSFRDRGKAEEALSKLQKKDYEGFIQSRNLGAKGTWYRVYVGQFTTKQQADDYLTRVKTDYKDSFVISPK
tara:strand:- start:5 stop:589 length:585 start_codon:yes stop_codon:yes gene_type:complete